MDTFQYGVNVSNKFDISLFSDGPPELTKPKDEVKKSKKPEGEKPKLGLNKQNTKKSTPQTELKGKQNDQNINKKEGLGKDAHQSERPSRGRGGFSREGRDNKENDGERRPFRRPPRDQENRGGDENVPPEFREKPEGSNRFNRFDDSERGRGRGRGRGGFRGRGGRGGGFGQSGERGGFSGGFGQPNPERSGKRDFDRHSGSDKTGIKAVDKREGGGRRNWGSFKDDIKNIEESQSMNQDSSEPTENWNQNEENVEVQESSTETPVPGAPDTINEEDVQPKQMTLQEYQLSQKKNRLRNQFQIRKAGEGVDGTQWKDGEQIRKSNIVKHKEKIRTSDDEEEEEDEHENDRKKKTKNNMTAETKSTLKIEITFNDNNRRGGRGAGRRGRGTGRGFYRGNSPRGGSGRGGNRGYREAAPRVDDEKDFPSLVKSVA